MWRDMALEGAESAKEVDAQQLTALDV